MTLGSFRRRTSSLARLTVALVLTSAGLASGQTPATLPPTTPVLPEPVAHNDANPTDAVLFSIRPEIYVSNDDLTQAALIFRYDYVAFRERRFLPGRRGVILRLEAPLSGAQLSGTSLKTGLGDVSGLALTSPYFTRRFAFVVGTGLSAPTATDRLLGSGKWVLAPAAAPVWFFRGGMAYVKVQGAISVAGDPARGDIRALQITPVFLRSLDRKSWILLDSETKTNFLRDGRTGIKSGAQYGRFVASKAGIWVKPEIWWGDNRDGKWNLKFGLVFYR